MTGKRKAELPDWDDGRTIAPMNVEGMPWYRPAASPEEKKKTSAGEKPGRVGADAMTREESRYYTWGALKAALAVTGVMCAGIVLFVLFCQLVWFR